ncbi:DUF5067 domain-containing protein [Dorea formicigenerans]|uniref:DUF5067 domain-containing protein n=1 Tax=Dorea formicigenerans ATCC 27755 TaxID=411461 RepID=B0G4E0_9FIRM|nr:hypothetical protein [Dorea formicigenerans]EDR47592.1 hypothetical protein DORFOR_01127 [Dorea formicigenerans ATCC 27755]UWP20044.1 DUF5067 domain-containing protein [Dorea formicigenerans]
MKRKIVTLMLVAMMAINVTACGGSNSESSKKTETASKEKEYVDDITAVASNPDSYNGKYIKFTGIVSTVDSNDDIYGCQVYVDMDYNNSVLVEIPKSIMSETPKTDDLINFDAKIEKAKDGQTVMGVDSTWAYLVADSAEKTTYLESFGKADATWEFTDKVAEQNGISISVTKVEFAKDETRFYVTATNNSSDKMNIWSSSSKVLQNGQQYEQIYTYNSFEEYPELSSELLPGASSSGILCFDKLDPAALQLYVEGASDNYELEFSPFIFDLAQ